MRVSVLCLALALASGYNACGRARPAAVAPSAQLAAESKQIDFAADVRPILESRCTPCHFAGGAMYERLPFDRPETIQKLGTKLFTRIKDEKEQRVIREFLAQLPGDGDRR